MLCSPRNKLCGWQFDAIAKAFSGNVLFFFVHFISHIAVQCVSSCLNVILSLYILFIFVVLFYIVVRTKKNSPLIPFSSKAVCMGAEYKNTRGELNWNYFSWRSRLNDSIRLKKLDSFFFRSLSLYPFSHRIYVRSAYKRIFLSLS